LFLAVPPRAISSALTAKALDIDRDAGFGGAAEAYRVDERLGLPQVYIPDPPVYRDAPWSPQPKEPAP
jgi:hypothetical protein